MNNIQQIHNWLRTAKGNPTSDIDFKTSQLMLNINLEELIELAEGLGKEQLSFFADLLKEQSEKIVKKLNSKEKLKIGKQHVLDALVDMEWVKHNISFFTNISPEMYQAHFDKVTESNFSKFCKSEQEAIDSVNDYTNKGINSYYKKEGNYWIILRTADNKILKSINFKEPLG